MPGKTALPGGAVLAPAVSWVERVGRQRGEREEEAGRRAEARLGRVRVGLG